VRGTFKILLRCSAEGVGGTSQSWTDLHDERENEAVCGLREREHVFARVSQDASQLAASHTLTHTHTHTHTHTQTSSRKSVI
jgi:hypothetical protein